ncbi:MAG: hypothetical protein Q7U75_00780 [Desulfobacterales bacterium]|nr:hypothetical protein [Desulfobacterales bacterium]
MPEKELAAVIVLFVVVFVVHVALRIAGAVEDSGFSPGPENGFREARAGYVAVFGCDGYGEAGEP